jgi:DNA replication protein DnaC
MSLIENYIKHLEKQAKPKLPIFKRGDIQAAWMAVGLLKNPAYKFDDVSISMFNALFENYDKGLCLCGSKGIGKTLNMDIFAKINTDLLKVNTECWEVTEIEIQYKAAGATFLDRIGQHPCLVVNDAGIESKTLNDYGTNRNIIADLLYLRYRQFQVNGFKTYLTTNLSYESLQAHYGSRLAERMNEMFRQVTIKGDSKR